MVMGVLFILALASYGLRFADHGLDWPGAGCLAVALLGQLLRFFTVGFVPRGTSGRNTRGQVADTLNTTGMYAVVRNPIYLGNFIIWFGLSLLMRSVWFTTVIVVFFTVFYERIIFRRRRFFTGEIRGRLHELGRCHPGDYSEIQELAAARPGFFLEIGAGQGIFHLFRHHRHFYGPGTAGRAVRLREIDVGRHLGKLFLGCAVDLYLAHRISEEKDQGIGHG